MNHLISGAAVLMLTATPAARAADSAPVCEREALCQAPHVHLANPNGVDLCHSVVAPCYHGLLRAGFTTADASLVTVPLEFGQQAGWMPGFRTYHGDHQAVGYAWLVPGFHVLRYRGYGESAREIIFNLANNKVPFVGPERVNYAPGMLFDSTYLGSVYKCGRVEIRKGDLSLELNSNE